MATLRDIEIDDYLAEVVRIEPLALEEEFVRLPSDLAYWNERYAQAMRAHLVAEIDRNRLCAQLRIECRERILLTLPKATESMVESAVEMDQRNFDAKMRAIEAEVDEKRLRGVLDAVRTKRDMLISLGAHVRIEMEHDPVIREEVRGRRLVREGQ
jgi:hypothetical protein